MSLVTNSEIQNVICQIRDLVGDRISTSDSVLHDHGQDEGWPPVEAPAAVVRDELVPALAVVRELAVRYGVLLPAWALRGDGGGERGARGDSRRGLAGVCGLLRLLQGVDAGEFDGRDGMRERERDRGG